MYFLKDDRKVNFNFNAWKYPTYSHFSFFETFRGDFAPSAPLPTPHKFSASDPLELQKLVRIQQIIGLNKCLSSFFFLNYQDTCILFPGFELATGPVVRDQ